MFGNDAIVQVPFCERWTFLQFILLYIYNQKEIGPPTNSYS